MNKLIPGMILAYDGVRDHRGTGIVVEPGAKAYYLVLEADEEAESFTGLRLHNPWTDYAADLLWELNYKWVLEILLEPDPVWEITKFT